MTGSSSTPSEKSAPTTPLDGLALHPTPDLIQHQQHQPATHQQLHPQLQQILLGNSEPVFLRRESHNAYAGRVVQQQLSPRDHSYFISNSARRQGRSLDPHARHNKNGVVAGAVPPTNTNNNNNNNNTILLRNSSPPAGVITDAHAALTLPRNNSQPSSSDVVGDVPDIAVTAPPAPEELLSFLSGNVSDRRASYRPINRPSTTSSTPPSAPSAGNLPPTEAATNNTTSAIPNGTWQRTPNIEVHHPPPSIHDDAHQLTTEDTLPSVLGGGGADHRTLQSMSPRERLDTASPPTLGFTSSRNVFSPNPHTSAPQHVDGVGGAERITSTSAGPDGGERVVVFPYHFSGKGGGDALHINPLQHARDRQGSPIPPPSPTDVVNPDNAHVPPSRRSSGAEIPSTTHVGDDNPSDPSTTHDGTQGKEQHGEAHNNSSVLNYDIDVKRRYSRHLQPEHSIMSEGGAEATMFEDSSARYSPSIITGTTSRHEFVQLSSTTILPRILRPNPLLDDGIGESDDGIHPRVFGVPSNFTSPSSSPHANATTQHVHVVASSSPATTPPTDDERPLVPEVSVLRSAALSPSLSEVDATTTTNNNNPHSRLLMDIANVPPSQHVLRMEELDENPAEVFTSLQAYLEHAAQLPSSPKFVEEARIINNNKNSNNAIARASYEQPPLGASNVEPQQQNRKLTRWMEDEPSVAGRASVHSRLDLTHTSCASSLYPLAGSPLAEEMKNFPHVVGDGITGSMHLSSSSSSSSSSCTPRATTNLPRQDALQVHGDVPPLKIEAPHPPPSSLSSTDNIQPATATCEKQASVHGTGTPVEATQHDGVGHPPYSSTNHGPLYAVSMWQPPSSRSGTPDDEDPPRHSAAVHHHHHDAAPPATREYQRGNGDHQRHRQHHRAHPLVPLPPIRKERNGVRPFWIHHPTIRGDDGPWKLVPLPKRYTRAAML